jgi:hypothetical protein
VNAAALACPSRSDATLRGTPTVEGIPFVVRTYWNGPNVLPEEKLANLSLHLAYYLSYLVFCQRRANMKAGTRKRTEGRE